MLDNIPADLQLVRLRDALKLTGLSRSTLYRMIQAGELARPFKLGRRAIAWRLSTFQAFLDKRTATSEANK